MNNATIHIGIGVILWPEEIIRKITDGITITGLEEPRVLRAPDGRIDNILWIAEHGNRDWAQWTVTMRGLNGEMRVYLFGPTTMEPKVAVVYMNNELHSVLVDHSVIFVPSTTE